MIDLRKYVGTKYHQLDENGKALGCMLPVYLMYPEIPRYDWPPEDSFAEYFLGLLKKHGQQMSPEEMKPGDVLAFRMPFNGLHIGVYLGNDEMAHCNNDTLEICRLSFYWRRLEGVYRCQTQYRGK